MFTIDETLQFIHSTDWKGSRLGLDRMKEMMRRLGNPQDDLRFIHVAGSNGKGSFSAMMSSVLSCAGYRTGMYSSPHLLRVQERIRIDGEEISDADLCRAAEKVSRAAADMSDTPTEFEIITAIAFVYFANEHCDLVVLEVGLGGRMDATNVITRTEIAVLMNITLEHTEVLGDTPEQIAFEKAGILKEGCDAVAYRGAGEVLRVFEEVCQKKAINLRVARFEDVRILRQDLSGQVFCWRSYRDLRINLIGEHQIFNAVVVLETVELLLQRGWKIAEDAVRRGLAGALWPARLEVIREDPLFLVDGAHNPQCIEMLVNTLQMYVEEGQAVILAGVLEDKDYPQMMKQLSPLAKAFVCLTPDNPHSLPGKKLSEYLIRSGHRAFSCDSVEDGIALALELADGGPVIACGSLYLAGELRQKAREILGTNDAASGED